MTDTANFETYRPLKLENLRDYLRARPESAAYLDPHAELDAREVGDGNLNLVFQVWERGRPERTLLLKQALPYVRAAGESWPLSTRRAHYEALALQSQFGSAPGLVPEPYWHDEEMSLSAMENLRAHRVIRGILSEGTKLPGLGEVIGRFLAATLFATSDFALESDEKRRTVGRFDNPELCRISEDLIFTEPYLEDAPRNHWNPLIEDEVRAFQRDDELKAEVARLKYNFLTSAQALLHGDLHTGSVMSDGTDHRVIDPEFAFVGPMGFDIGAFIANLLLNACAQEVRMGDGQQRADFRRYLMSEARTLWGTFEAGFREKLKTANSPSWAPPSFQDGFLRSVLRDAASFAGCKMLRRVVGFAHVSDLEGIENPEERAVAERLALNIGQALIKKGRTINSFGDIESIASEFLPDLR